MAAIKLPRLYPGIVENDPELFYRYWDEAMNSIEETLNAILSIPAIEDALADLDAATQAALDAADVALDAASDATTATEVNAQEQSIVSSYISGTPPFLTADEFGDVLIFNHTRVYGDSTLNPNVSITGDTLVTGQLPGNIIRVYYDDPTRSDTTPTFQYMVDPATPPVQGGNRHSVGAVVIPASGTQDGGGVRPPGYVQVE